MTLYVKFDPCSDCETLNDLMYSEFVYADGQWKFPYGPGTTRWCTCFPHPELDQCVATLDENMTEYAQRNPEVASLISVQLTYAECVEQGFFNDE